MPRPLALLVLLVIALPACSSSDSSPEQAPVRAIAPDPAPTLVDPEPEREAIDLQLDLGSADAKHDPVLAPRSGDTSDHEVVEPQAGQLTAGEWNDHDHWDHWLELLTNTEQETDPNFWMHEETWSVAPRRRFEVLVVDPTGKPATDVEVDLVRANPDTIVWRARTNNEGLVWLFDGAFGEPTEGSLEIVVHGKTFTAPTDGTRTVVRLADSIDRSDAVDILFMVDTTGSMSDELNYLKAELRDVVRKIEQAHPDLSLRLSVNFYRDHKDAYVVRSFPFTDDVDEVRAQIHEQRANGGGDVPEAVDEALENAVVDHKWSTDARARIVFFVLDAPPHTDDHKVQRFHASTRKAASGGIQVIPVIGSGAKKDTEYLLRSAAILTGGTYIFLTDDSGIGGGHTRPTIGPHPVEYLRDLMVRVVTERVR